MESKKEYVIHQYVSPFSGARVGKPQAVHQNLVGPGVGRNPCTGIVTRYSYADAARLELKVELTFCSVCRDYHT